MADAGRERQTATVKATLGKRTAGGEIVVFGGDMNDRQCPTSQNSINQLTVEPKTGAQGRFTETDWYCNRGSKTIGTRGGGAMAGKSKIDHAFISWSARPTSAPRMPVSDYHTDHRLYLAAFG